MSRTPNLLPSRELPPPLLAAAVVHLLNIPTLTHLKLSRNGFDCRGLCAKSTATPLRAHHSAGACDGRRSHPPSIPPSLSNPPNHPRQGPQQIITNKSEPPQAFGSHQPSQGNAEKRQLFHKSTLLTSTCRVVGAASQPCPPRPEHPCQRAHLLISNIPYLAEGDQLASPPPTLSVSIDPRPSCCLAVPFLRACL